jgi:S-adenosylmethionine/arginine decarboxylase-like enzyme
MWEFTGKHLVVDAVCSNKRALLDVQVGNRIMQDIVSKIDMTMILPPVSVEFPHAVSEMTRVLESLDGEGLGDSQTAQLLRKSLQGRIDQAYGYSTFLMIAESHLCMHTFPETDYLTFDCYSCKDFDSQLVVSMLTEAFGITDITSNVIDRAAPV